MKILIVDDDPVIIIELQSVVANLGKVFVATTGQSAIAIAKDIEPDIILLDIGLPDMDGFEVLQELNDNNQLLSVNVIVITAHKNFENHLKSLSQGATDFIIKPINAVLLQKKIKSIIKNRETLLNQTGVAATSLNSLDGRFRNLLGMMSEAVVISDELGTIKMVNKFCNLLFGYKNGELIGKTVDIFSPKENQRHDNYLKHYQITGESSLNGVPQQIEAVTKQGKKIQIELNVTDYSDLKGNYYLSLIRDQSEKNFTQARLLKAALYDSLTGAYSREALKLDSEKTSMHSGGKNVFACLLDIDRFHEINAVFGLSYSDDLLKLIASRLRRQLAELPVRLYRVGGDAFIIKSMQTISKKEEDALKKDIRIIFDDLLESLRDNVSHRPSLSAVVRILSVEILKGGALVSMLEDDLRNSKNSGFVGDLFYIEHSNYDRSLQLAELAQSLLNNIDVSTLSVVFQPKVSEGNTFTSAEALLRWDNKSYNLLNLGDFICTAEDTGTIIAVGYFVFKKVCELLQDVASLGREMKVSVNLSLRQIADGQLVDKFVDICKEFNVNTKHITFEVTETVMAENIELLTTVLHLLKAQGFSLSIDDFGTGHSNLRYINRLPIDEIKIDKSFIDDICDVHHSYPIVDTVINMAKIMKLRVVAEGVETEIQVNYLRNKQCDYIQGFYFFRPLKKEDWLEVFKQSETISH